mmetsp:Transcript_31307/g.79102  ORF Transcript_31307/g.79102 Transcript_31307/m.79102 type:complete len:354 (+) Transcript_31307:169-1230(+)
MCRKVARPPRPTSCFASTGSAQTTRLPLTARRPLPGQRWPPRSTRSRSTTCTPPASRQPPPSGTPPRHQRQQQMTQLMTQKATPAALVRQPRLKPAAAGPATQKGAANAPLGLRASPSLPAPQAPGPAARTDPGRGRAPRAARGGGEGRCVTSSGTALVAATGPRPHRPQLRLPLRPGHPAASSRRTPRSKPTPRLPLPLRQLRRPGPPPTPATTAAAAAAAVRLPRPPMLPSLRPQRSLHRPRPPAPRTHHQHQPRLCSPLQTSQRAAPARRRPPPPSPRRPPLQGPTPAGRSSGAAACGAQQRGQRQVARVQLRASARLTAAVRTAWSGPRRCCNRSRRRTTSRWATSLRR